MLFKTFFLALTAALVVADAPLESGNWVEDTFSYSNQACAGGTVSGDRFKIPTSPNGDTSGSGCANGHLRAERRYKDDYSSGVRQFGGTFKINSGGGTRISLKQTFNGDAGPYFILAVENGRLYSVRGGETLVDNVANVGQTVRINTVHNTGNNRFSCYVNGVERYRDENAPEGSFYDKIGAYTTDSGKGPLDVTWTNVQFWHRA